MSPVTVTGHTVSPLDVLLNQTVKPRQTPTSIVRGVSDFERLMQGTFTPKGGTVLASETPVLEKVIVRAKKFARPLKGVARVGSRAMGLLGIGLGTYDALDLLYEKLAKPYGRKARKTAPSGGGGGSKTRLKSTSERKARPARSQKRGRKPDPNTATKLDAVTVTAKKGTARGRRTAEELQLQRERQQLKAKAKREQLAERKEQRRAKQEQQKENRQAKAADRKRARDEKREAKKTRRAEKRFQKEADRLARRNRSRPSGRNKTGSQSDPLTREQPRGAQSPQSEGKRKCKPKPKSKDECGCPRPGYKLELAQWEAENCGSPKCR